MANFCPCITPVWGALIFLMRPSMWKFMVGPLLISLVLTIGVLVVLYIPAVEDWEVTQLESLSEEYEPSLFGKNFTEIFNEDNRESVKVGLKVAAPFEAALAAYIGFQALFSKVFGKIAMLCLKDRPAYTDFLEKHNLNHNDEPDGGPWGCACGTIVSLGVLASTLYLNFFPVVGQVLFALANGWLYTWQNIGDLLTIIGYKSFGSQFKHMLCHLYSYTLFGAICFSITIIPLLGMVCTGGFACAAALLLEGYLVEGTLGPEFEEGEPPESSLESEGNLGSQESTKQLLPPPDAPAARGGSNPSGGSDEGTRSRDSPKGGGSSRGAGGAGVRGQVQVLLGTASQRVQASGLAQTALQDERVQRALQDERVQKLHGKIGGMFS